MFLRKAIEKRQGYINIDESGFGDGWLFGALKGDSRITARSAAKNSNVYTCVGILADDIAKLPIHTYTEGNNRTEGMKHPVAMLLYTRPNSLMSAFTFKQTMQMHVGLYGNAYALIDFGKNGYPDSLWPLDPMLTYPYLDLQTGKLIYITSTTKGEQFKLDPSEILHFKTMAKDGILGRAPWKTLIPELEGQSATKEFISKFYKNGALASGVLSTESKLNSKAKDKLRADFAKRYSGVDNSGSTVVLDMGLKYQQLGMQLDQAQFLETQKFGINEVAKVYRIPPHKLAQLDRATYSNAEAMGIEYIKTTLLPIFTQWEQELNYKLFATYEQSKYYVKFNATAELRGDSASRSAYYKEMITNGVYTLNEIRAMEEMQQIEDGLGDKHFVSLNYTTLDNLEKYQLMKANDGRLKGGEGNDGKGTQNGND